MKNRLLIAFLAIASVSYGDEISVSSFKYINSNENSLIIDQSEAQNLLNVDITPGGRSVKKRPGYGVYKTLGTSQGIHGGHHFFDATGNDVQVWGSSTSLYGIVSDATPARIVSSATLNATWDCADTQGSAYCVNSARDAYIRTNGTSLTSWHTSPLGTMVEATPDRIIVAGVIGNVNTIYVSASNLFTSFVAGPLSTDAFTEVIAAPGSKLTHLRWGCGKVLWWKDQSFGIFDFEDQYDATVKIVSDNIGSFDNTSAMDPGGSVWFRGQDGHIYQYDCSGLIKQTIEISPQVQASGHRTTNFWEYTSQNDWEGGSIVPSGSLSTTNPTGAVTPSQYSDTDDTVVEFSSNIANSTNIHVGTTYFTMGQYNDSNSTFTNVPNNSFETGTFSGWTRSDVGSTTTSTWTIVTSGSGCGSFSGINGSYVLLLEDSVTFNKQYLEVVDLSGTSVGEAQIIRPGTVTTCVVAGTATITSTSPSVVGKRVTLRIKNCSGTSNCNSYTAMNTASSFIFTGSVSVWYGYPSGGFGGNEFFDFVSGGVNVGTGTFVSRTFNTGFTSSTIQIQASWTLNDTVPYFEIQHSTSATGRWYKVVSGTGTNAVSNRYIRYISSMTPQATEDGQTQVTSVRVLTLSTGTYYSTIKNAPSLTAWSTFNPLAADGGGSHAYYVRSSTNSFTVLSSTPSWVAQTANSVVSASTGTFFQFRDDFSVNTATDTTLLDAMVINWYEGTTTDQPYMLYFDNAVWASVAYGTGVSSNTYIFRRDLINEGWGLYSFGAGGILVQNNRLYFGDVASTGRIYQFASGMSDNGSDINAFWKSKDFSASDPFLETQVNQIDTYVKKNTNETLTATYALNTTTTTTSFSISLSSSTQTLINFRKLLPPGKNGYTFNVQYGDTSDSSDWELFGFRVKHAPQPYKPSQ